jgi:DNA-binding response OmpR family regulator
VFFFCVSQLVYLGFLNKQRGAGISLNSLAPLQRGPRVKSGPSESLVLLVGADSPHQADVARHLSSMRVQLHTVSSNESIVSTSVSLLPDCIVVVETESREAAISTVHKVRSNGDLRLVPVVVAVKGLTAGIVAELFQAGADDVLLISSSRREFVARVQTKLDRPTVPVTDRRLPVRDVTLSHSEFVATLQREMARSSRKKSACTLAIFDVVSDGSRAKSLSVRQQRDLSKSLVEAVTYQSRVTDTFFIDDQGRVLFLLHDTNAQKSKVALRRRLERFNSQMSLTNSSDVALRAVVGYVETTRDVDALGLIERARVAVDSWEPSFGSDMTRFNHQTSFVAGTDSHGLLRAKRKDVLLVGSSELRESLSARGAHVFRARSLREGLALSKEFDFELIVVDSNASVASVQQFFREHRKDSRALSIPVVVLTDSKSAVLLAEMMALGADDVISRGRGLEEVVHRIMAKLDRAPLLREDSLFTASARVLSKRGFIEQIELESARAARYGTEFVVASWELAEVGTLNDAISKRAVASLFMQIALQIQG